MNAKSVCSGHYNVAKILSFAGMRIHRSAKERRNVKRANGILVNGVIARL